MCLVVVGVMPLVDEVTGWLVIPWYWTDLAPRVMMASFAL